ncbi:MAG: hypothetical protein KTQ49_04270 [Candidatus Omnitrophica bacterium]|nr:hypothetical protein [Candidatus Omnitrophota bacterium]
MKLGSFLIGFFLFWLAAVPAGTAQEISRGETLVRELWKNVQEGNWARIEDHMIPEFQSVHEDIARNAKEEIELLQGMGIDRYELSYIQSTETDSLIIVSYRVLTAQFIGDLDLPTRAAMRLSGWVKTPEGWKWAFHANLNPLQELPPEPAEPEGTATE